MSELHAMPIAELTIMYSLDDRGEPVIGLSHDGDDNKVTLLGMLEMAKDTIMQPEWDGEEFSDD